MITHDMAIARYAQRIIRLKDGLVESDTVNTEVNDDVQ
jgi:putative ABC transport system ATP-binding protein